MAITMIDSDALAFVKKQGGSLVRSDKGRVTIELPRPWNNVSGTWVSDDFPGVAAIVSGGIPLIIDVNLGDDGWILLATANGIRQSVGDAASQYKIPSEKVAKIVERAQLLAPGKMENWGKKERGAVPKLAQDPLSLALATILAGHLSQFPDKPEFSGTRAEMLEKFRLFAEHKRQKPFDNWSVLTEKFIADAQRTVDAVNIGSIFN